MNDIIVIGAGTAGMTAALYSLRNSKTVTIIESESIGGQIAFSPRVENFPSIKEISGAELANNLYEQVESLGGIFEFDKVIKVEKIENHFLVTTEYSTYQALSVIIATGVKHRHINVDREDELIGNGVSYCAVCDGAFYNGETVSLIGDGNTALQYSLLLANICAKVYVCTLFDKFFGDALLVKKLKERKNVEIIHNLSLKEFQGTDKLTGLTFENTTSHTKVNISCSACFIAIGQIPDNKAFSNLVDLDKEGYIIADENCETKTKGLFAVGDCRVKKIRQLTTAVSDGAIAAVNASTFINTRED